MYFFPSDDFQILENKFIKFAFCGERAGIYRARNGSVNGRVRRCAWAELDDF